LPPVRRSTCSRNERRVTDPLVRLAIVVGVAGVALSVARALRKGVAVRRKPVQLVLPVGGLVLFTSESCATCEWARAALVEAGVSDITHVDWETSPEIFMAAGVDRVPTLVWLDSTGSGWMVHGVPSPGRIRKWLGGP
jgi:hypothetical protein